ncbi:hypothetical protein KSS87_014929 [Heliosperma pusillum]|nr:hypothetical protein KSS87_014929 [Heliosperma pusillum]
MASTIRPPYAPPTVRDDYSVKEEFPSSNNSKCSFLMVSDLCLPKFEFCGERWYLWRMEPTAECLALHSIGFAQKMVILEVGLLAERTCSNCLALPCCYMYTVVNWVWEARRGEHAGRYTQGDEGNGLPMGYG